ncbi:glycoside hydrolase family 79 protein [Serpula lacrymans var. lacrymans S7.9]|uniref:Glycoside hydrolase family 79 protein n=1 Tax=Serpula lacrymans var. lacrymans (strain S7.9) TaxID=578457 RepID=F8NPI8_SERL9|nr:glycoside hydrolase family 79 protein [Serpula lacrymans var. lacrymans S7.9]EGO27198.1 glycoside hydrolase family 79 protein [Serpula lacrymans var. lacrymans S7.9]
MHVLLGLAAVVSWVNPSLLSLSLEFFAFPEYTRLSATTNCLDNIATLRGAQPAIRIGGTTQDRATYDPTLTQPVNYTVASPVDAPASLTYGPAFFSLAAQLKGEVTVGLNRQLNNQTNSLEGAEQALRTMPNLLAMELGNEPEFWASTSPIIPSGTTWTPTTDGESQKLWFTDFAPSIGNMFQAAVYLQYPTWSTAGIIPLLESAVTYVKTFSGHSYPQSACGGASTNLTQLMSHSKVYFLGETNSATCGGGGISPMFGAGLWVMDYVLQGALNNVDRLYFHQGTIAACPYCFWGNDSVAAPYYGAVFVSDFLGTDGVELAMLDDGTGPIGIYAVYSANGAPQRLLVYNSNYYDGTGTRTNTSVTFSGLPSSTSLVNTKRMTAQNATAIIGEGGIVTIGGDGTFDSSCQLVGAQSLEQAAVSGGTFNVSVAASEALIVYLG